VFDSPIAKFQFFHYQTEKLSLVQNTAFIGNIEKDQY